MPRNANQSKSSNYSLDFDGSSDISISGISVAGEFTLSAWVKGITSSTFYIFGSTNTSNWFRIQGGNAVNLKVGNGQLNDSSPNTIPTFTFNSTDWYCIVATRDSSNNIQVYVNGSVDSNYTPRNTATPVNANFVPNFIGRNQASYTTGQIDAVSIYDYALSESQVTTLWGGGTEVSNPMALPSTPITYYPLGTSAWNGQYLAENNAIGDYVFDITTTSQRFLTPLNAAEKTNLTYSVWFKTSSGINSNKILFSSGRYGTFQASMYTNQIIVTAQVYTGSLTGSSTSATINFSYGDNKWHHYVLNFDGSHMKFYIDGVLKARNAKSGVLNYHPNSLRDTGIGNTSYVSSNAGLVGEYSNFISHNATLTDGNVSVGDTATGEIATLYNYGSPIQDLSNIPQRC